MPITGVDRATLRARRWKGIGSGREGGREKGIGGRGTRMGKEEMREREKRRGDENEEKIGGREMGKELIEGQRKRESVMLMDGEND